LKAEYLSAIIILVALSIAVGVVASFYPAIVSSKMEPYEAIRSGER